MSKNSAVLLRAQETPGLFLHRVSRCDPHDHAKMIPRSNEWWDPKKNEIGGVLGHQKVLTPWKPITPCSGITLERRALRVKLLCVTFFGEEQIVTRTDPGVRPALSYSFVRELSMRGGHIPNEWMDFGKIDKTREKCDPWPRVNFFGYEKDRRHRRSGRETSTIL